MKGCFLAQLLVLLVLLEDPPHVVLEVLSVRVALLGYGKCLVHELSRVNVCKLVITDANSCDD